MTDRRRARAAPTPKSPLAFDDFVAGCTPTVWRLRVHAVELDTGDVAAALQTTIPFPADRDLARAIGGVFGEPGRFRVSVLGRANQTAQAEADRARLQLKKGENLPRAIVTVTSDDVARGAAVPRQTPAAARGGARAVVADDPDVLEAEKRARLAKARQAEAIADAAARKAERSDGHDGTAALAPVLQQLLQQSQQPKGDGGMAAVLQVLQQGQQQFQALMLQLLQQSQQREQALLAALSERQAPANLPELDNVKRTIETFQGLRELLRSERVDDDRPRGMTETIIDAIAPQLGELLPRLLNRQAPPPTAAAAAAAPTAPPLAIAAPAPSLAIAAPAPSLQAQRVQTFVRALVQEACAGSAPEALAERLASDIDGLPASVRAPLDAGQLDDTIAAILPFLLDDESRTTLQAVARDVHVRPWLIAFATACSVVDDDDSGEDDEASA